MKIRNLLINGLIFVFFLTACQAQTASPSPQNTAGSTSSVYPAPTSPQATEGVYPAPAAPVEAAYPGPASTQPSSSTAIPFKINKPVSSVATQVTGTGTPGVPLVLVDLTNMGELLSSTTIKADGTFVFDVKALPVSSRIGLMLGDLANTSWTTESFYDPGYNGEEALLIPNVGFLYDTCIVK